MKKRNFKAFIAEGLLIVFSVLFALFINKLYENYKIQTEKEVALESIKKELRENQKILKNWKEKHENISKRIGSLHQEINDSLKREFLRYEYFNLGVLTNNKSLFDKLVSSTAWETAKSTGIISEFDFETTQKLTDVYAQQEVITERTMAKILDLIFDADTHKMENIDLILVQFRLFFSELTGQEYLLDQLYVEALEQIEE